MYIIILLLFLTGCSTTTQAISLETSGAYAVEIKKNTESNTYTEAYNSITKNISELISDYNKVCGLSDKCNYSGEIFSYDPEKNPEFFESIKKPLDIKNENADISEKYQKLYDSINPLISAYNNSKQYYSKELNKNITELNFLHNEFLINYVQFKNAYLEFKDIVINGYNSKKNEELETLTKAGLNIHNDFDEMVIITQDLARILKEGMSKQEISNYEEIQKTVGAFNTQIRKIKAYDENDYRDYGFVDEQILNLQNIIICALDIESELNYSFEFYNDENERKKETFIDDLNQKITNFISKSDKLTEAYNDFLSNKNPL